jgi:hypothetical protein
MTQLHNLYLLPLTSVIFYVTNFHRIESEDICICAISYSLVDHFFTSQTSICTEKEITADFTIDGIKR